MPEINTATVDAPASNADVIAPEAAAPVVAASDATPPTFDQVLANLTSEQYRNLSADDMDGLAKGDLETIKRITGAKDPEPAVAVVAPPAAEKSSEPAPDATKGIRRINLTRLNVEQQKGIGDLVYALADGNAEKIADAASRLGIKTPSAPAPAADSAPVTADATPPAEQTASVPPAIQSAKDKIADLEAKIDAANEAYNNAEANKLTRELVRAERELERAEEEDRAQTSAQQSYATAEREAFQAVTDKYGEKMDEDPEFETDLGDARDLAELRKDPILSKPDWPLLLADRVYTKRYGQAASATAVNSPVQAQVAVPVPPTTLSRPVGAVAPPNGGAQPEMSVEEAVAQIENMSLEEVNAIMDADARMKR